MSIVRDRRKHVASLEGASAGVWGQHVRGRLSARERIDVLVDTGSFRAVAPRSTRAHAGLHVPAEAVIAGRARVHRRTVYVYAQDAGTGAGALGHAPATRVQALLTRALTGPGPVIALLDSPGVPLQAGAEGLAGHAAVLGAQAGLAGRVPQVALIMGPCAGMAALVPGLADLTFMVRGTSHAFLTGPEVVRSVAQEPLSAEALGGAAVHAARSGVADGVFEDDVEGLLELRRLCTYLPAGAGEGPPRVATSDPPDRAEPSLETLVPCDPRDPFDMAELVQKVLDEEDLFELGPEHAPNLVTGLGRLAGCTVGVVANQPLVRAGCIDTRGARKGARFLRFCEQFGLPVILFCDAPGFLPGSSEEYGGLIRDAGGMLGVLAAMRVPRVYVVPRRAYGGAALAMGIDVGSACRTLAWPGAEVALMGAQAAAELIGDRVPEAGSDGRERVDGVVRPRHTRREIHRALATLRRHRPRRRGSPPGARRR
ncbi:MAG: methylmalonyl-CoA carboxyltransferase [Gammaproteobacteria bacterium]|nr:methylmalonyl-CoA carboxyltransferase [Gammaproteobacteria bacterium]NIR84396.1 methylmalonyl-CoA carboxyltransferase [Gammaproteobacteria bacterium]NIR90877.1 methylmalonyl-CoA carboxyltransferase [Gammaproteobacteria bacterium]NIU07063.1 methylmalonyl-CoA carboxyltransferase [Gammaproteobacteria bacterium]NIV76192.1 methylmalonyl-CoA carboxyltransferase [Gammaproteobacteria bacterium]